MSESRREAPGAVDGGEAAPMREQPAQPSMMGAMPAAVMRRKIQRRLAQRKGNGDISSETVHAAAEAGTQGTGGSLPHLDQIQKSFGHHDVSGIRAHTDDRASAASRQMGAEAYASGNHVAFAGAPSLHTAAHEAAHVVQQAGGVQLSGGVGAEGDAHEQHADAVGDAVVRGESAEHLLDQVAGQPSGRPAVQRKVEIYATKKDEDDKTYTKYNDIPESDRLSIEKGPIPEWIPEKLGNAFDESTARSRFKHLIIQLVESEDMAPDNNWNAIIENAWQDVFVILKESADKQEEKDNSSIRKDLVEGKLEGEGKEVLEKVQELEKLPIERLLRIAGVSIGTLVPKIKYYTVTRPDVSEQLSRVCKKFASFMGQISEETKEVPNYLEKTERDYSGIPDAAKYILEKYPPTQCCYVGMGASPAPIAKYLEILSKKEGDIQVYDVPLSGLQGVLQSIREVWEKNGPKKANLCKFLDGCLGKFSSVGKQVVVMDFSTGNSLFAAEYIIGNYLHERHESFDVKQVVPLSLSVQDGEKFTGSPPSGESNITAIELKTSGFKQLVEDLQSSIFKDFGYRSSEKNDTKMIMEGTHETKHLIGGYERLVRDLTEHFKL